MQKIDLVNFTQYISLTLYFGRLLFDIYSLKATNVAAFAATAIIDVLGIAFYVAVLFFSFLGHDSSAYLRLTEILLSLPTLITLQIITANNKKMGRQN